MMPERGSARTRAVGLLIFTVGCSAGEAVVDGFYGGISDTVAGAFSSTLLGLLGRGGG